MIVNPQGLGIRIDLTCDEAGRLSEALAALASYDAHRPHQRWLEMLRRSLDHLRDAEEYE